jgi:hypothetical protein
MMTRLGFDTSYASKMMKSVKVVGLEALMYFEVDLSSGSSEYATHLENQRELS